MADEATTPTTPETTAPAAVVTQPSTATPTGPVYTQADIDAAAKRAHDAGAAEARRALQGKTPSKATPAESTAATPTPAPTTPTGTARAYERAVAAYDFPDEAMALLDEEFDRVKPADPRAWVEQRATAFRVPKRGAATPTPITQTPTTAATQTAPAVVAGAPITGNGAPAAPPTVTADTPILSMSVPDRQALAAKIGHGAFAERMLKEMTGRTVPVR